MRLLFLFYVFKKAFAYNLCVVGSSSGLGKELIYQATIKRDLTVLGLTGSCRTKTTYPCRENSFQRMKHLDTFNHRNLVVDNYWNSTWDKWRTSIHNDYEHLIFTTTAQPFKHDYTHILMSKMINTLPPSCKSVTWIPHEAWYMHNSVHRQAEIIKTFPTKQFIFRPKTLSNEAYYRDVMTRERLARRILNNIENENHKYFGIL